MVRSTEVTAPAVTVEGRLAVSSAMVTVSSSVSSSRRVARLAVPRVCPRATPDARRERAQVLRLGAAARHRHRDGHRPGRRARERRLDRHGHPLLRGVRRSRERHRGGRLRLRLPRDGDRVVLRRRPFLGRHPHRDGVGPHRECERAASRAPRHRRQRRPLPAHLHRRLAGVGHRRGERQVLLRVRHRRRVRGGARREGRGRQRQRRERAPEAIVGARPSDRSGPRSWMGRSAGRHVAMPQQDRVAGGPSRDRGGPGGMRVAGGVVGIRERQAPSCRRRSCSCRARSARRG